MANQLNDSNREFKRIRHTAFEKVVLDNNGLTATLSSNISAVGEDGNDLIVRFHNGSVYRYPNQAKLYDKLVASNSKGRTFYNLIRKKNLPFIKEETLTLESDIPKDDSTFFKEFIDVPNQRLDDSLIKMGMFIPPIEENALKLVILQDIINGVII